MDQVWTRWGHVLVTCALALPVVGTVTAVRARRLGWRGAVAEVAAVAGPLPFVWMILTPLPQDSDVHLVPLHELRWYLNAPPDVMVVQLGGNLAVFATFGAGAPVRWKLPLWWVMLLASLGSLTVELLQFMLDMGRVASVDDVLLNTAGAGLGALTTRRWWARCGGGDITPG